MTSEISDADYGHLAQITRSAIAELYHLAKVERDRAKHADSDELREDYLIAAERYASRAWSMNEGYIRDFGWHQLDHR